MIINRVGVLIDKVITDGVINESVAIVINSILYIARTLQIAFEIQMLEIHPCDWKRNRAKQVVAISVGIFLGSCQGTVVKQSQLIMEPRLIAGPGG